MHNSKHTHTNQSLFLLELKGRLNRKHLINRIVHKFIVQCFLCLCALSQNTVEWLNPLIGWIDMAMARRSIANHQIVEKYIWPFDVNLFTSIEAKKKSNFAQYLNKFQIFYSNKIWTNSWRTRAVYHSIFLIKCVNVKVIFVRYFNR